MPGETVYSPGVFYLTKVNLSLILFSVMNNKQLRTILPPSLRSRYRHYYYYGQRPHSFVVITSLGLSDFEIKMGKWSSTPKNNSVALCKSIGDPSNCHRYFAQESLQILRQDEFEWMMRQINLIYNDYEALMNKSMNGDLPSVITFNYLRELAKQLSTEAEYIFNFLKHNFKYDPDALISNPW